MSAVSTSLMQGVVRPLYKSQSAPDFFKNVKDLKEPSVAGNCPDCVIDAPRIDAATKRALEINLLTPNQLKDFARSLYTIAVNSGNKEVAGLLFEDALQVNA